MAPLVRMAAGAPHVGTVGLAAPYRATSHSLLRAGDRLRSHAAGLSVTILTQEALLALTGLKQKAALRRHLRREGIRFCELGGRITTTEQAITDSLTGAKKKRTSGLDWSRLDGD